jgi:hypothetical protein
MNTCEQCPCCGEISNTVRAGRKTMTAYVDDAKNVVPEMCDMCYVEYVDYWAERWADYYAGR